MTRNPIALFIFGFFILEAALFTFVDQPLSEYLRSVDANNPGLINVFRAYTDIGKSKWWLILSGMSVAACAGATRLPKLQSDLRSKIIRSGNDLLFFFMSIVLSGIVTDIIKPMLGRARPVMLEREGFFGFHPFSFQATLNSMPSGHTTTAFAIATALTFLLPRGRVLWFAFALAIAISRIMVNAHYLSDICAGAEVGILTVLCLHAKINHNVMRHIKYSIFPIDTKKRLG